MLLVNTKTTRFLPAFDSEEISMSLILNKLSNHTCFIDHDNQRLILNEYSNARLGDVRNL